MNGQREKTPNCGNWAMASRSAGFPPVESVCGTITAGREAVHRSARIDGCELFRQWRPVDFSKGNGSAWLVKPGQSARGCSRTARAWSSGNHAPRIAERLPAVCGHVVPTRLRSIKAQYSTWLLHAYGSRKGIATARSAANRCRPGTVATCQKIKVSGPATEQTKPTSFRHGTRAVAETIETPRLRSATEQNTMFFEGGAFRHGSPFYIAISSPVFCGDLPCR